MTNGQIRSELESIRVDLVRVTVTTVDMTGADDSKLVATLRDAPSGSSYRVIVDCAAYSGKDTVKAELLRALKAGRKMTNSLKKYF